MRRSHDDLNDAMVYPLQGLADQGLELSKIHSIEGQEVCSGQFLRQPQHQILTFYESSPPIVPFPQKTMEIAYPICL